MRSLRARLFAVWALSLVAAVALGLILLRLSGQSDQLRLARADTVAGQACERIADRFGYYVANWAGPPAGATRLDDAARRDLGAVLGLAIGGATQGGIWHAGEGIVAGIPSPTLLSAEERAAIDAIATTAADQGTSERRTLAASGLSVLLRACPLGGPISGLVAWARVGAGGTTAFAPLRIGLAVLLALVLGIASWLAWLIASWDRKVRAVEAAIARAESPDLPEIAATGEPSLDRIVFALNGAARKLAEARADTEAMAHRAALAERLAALGRVAAGVAHEIRNPLAAMRLRAENALHGDFVRRGAALEAVLAQVARLDGLLGELLAMTQRRTPAPQCVELGEFLKALSGDATEVNAAVVRGKFDPELVSRALANLVDNARRHAGAGGRVALSAAREGMVLRFTVADSGGGVDPALRATLMEPFVTGRADGTGLGLAIAREIADAHGGRLILADAGGAVPGRGAVFVLEVPFCAC